MSAGATPESIRFEPIDDFSRNPSLDAVNANKELSVLYLLSQPDFAVTHSRASQEIQSNTGLTSSQWEKARRDLRSDRYIYQPDYTNGESRYSVRLDPVAILDKAHGTEFVTMRVLGQMAAHIDLSPEIPTETTTGLTARLHSVISTIERRQQYEEDRAKLKADLQQRREEIKQAGALGDELFSSIDNPQKVPKELEHQKTIVFQFNEFATTYAPKDFAKLHPAHKLLLSIGSSADFGQTRDQQLNFAHRLINKHTHPKTHLSPQEIADLLDTVAVNSLIESHGDQTILTPLAMDMLRAHRGKRSSPHLA